MEAYGATCETTAPNLFNREWMRIDANASAGMSLFAFIRGLPPCLLSVAAEPRWEHLRHLRMIFFEQKETKATKSVF
jgi:hypothetical protein